MNTDPIADYLTRIRNALRAGLASLEVPASTLKIEMTKLLQREGYVHSYELHENKDLKRRTLRIKLKYDTEGYPVIRHIRRESRPGLRKYRRVGNLPRVLNGAGIAILSTNKGLLTDREARRAGVGGEILCTLY